MIKKGFLSCLIFIISITTFAEKLKWEMDLSVKGKYSTNKGTKTISANPFEEFSFKQGDIKAKFFVEKYLGDNWEIDPKKVDSYLVKAKIYRVINGKETLIFNPKLVTKLDQDSKVTLSSGDEQKVELNLKPSKL